MGVVVMRGLLALLVLCFLNQHDVFAQTVIEEPFPLTPDERVMYDVREATGADTVDEDICGDQNLVVFNSEEEFDAFVAEVGPSELNLDAGDYYIGVLRVENKPELRTFGGRKVPFINFPGSEDIDGERCVVVTLNNPSFPEAPWKLADCAIVSGARYICMTAEDDCDDDCDPAPDTSQRTGDTCFWNPAPRSVATYNEATDLCRRNKGRLLNLLDEADLDEIDEHLERDDAQSWYWLGLRQEAGSGHWAWDDDLYPDLPLDNWAVAIDYGSSRVNTPYLGVLKADNKKIELWNILDYSETVPFSQEASVICEAEKDEFAMENSPIIEWANKDMDDDKVVYTCKDGYHFEGGVPGDKVEIEVTCELRDLETARIPKCIPKNPCELNPCGLNSWCVPFIYNKDKPYICQCDRGYREDNYGRCIASEILSNTIIITFSVAMLYDSDVNNLGEEDNTEFREALTELGDRLYQNVAVLQSFRVRPGAEGTMEVEVVFGLYMPADVTQLSVLAYKFADYVRRVGSVGLEVDDDFIPFVGTVYFKTSAMAQKVAITDVCSLFNGIGQCNGNPCRPEGQYPVCDCLYAYQGRYCEEPPPGPDVLSQTEIGLIVAIILLFLVVLIVMPLIICCLLRPRVRMGGNYMARQPEAQTYAGSPVYSSGARYVTKPAGFNMVRYR